MRAFFSSSPSISTRSTASPFLSAGLDNDDDIETSSDVTLLSYLGFVSDNGFGWFLLCVRKKIEEHRTYLNNILTWYSCI